MLRNRSISISNAASSLKAKPVRDFQLDLPDFGECQQPSVGVRVGTVHVAQLGGWLFQTRRSLPFSASTLYIALGLLDALRQAGFVVLRERVELLGVVALLLSSKFNEAHHITILKLNARTGKQPQWQSEQFRQLEADVLEALGFTVMGHNSLYLRFSDLHERFIHSCPTRVQNFCKICLQAPDLQRFGSEKLVEAIGLLCGRRCIEREGNSCVRELMATLLQLENSDYL